MLKKRRKSTEQKHNRSPLYVYMLQEVTVYRLPQREGWRSACIKLFQLTLKIKKEGDVGGCRHRGEELAVSLSRCVCAHMNAAPADLLANIMVLMSQLLVSSLPNTWVTSHEQHENMFNFCCCCCCFDDEVQASTGLNSLCL